MIITEEMINAQDEIELIEPGTYDFSLIDRPVKVKIMVSDVTVRSARLS